MSNLDGSKVLIVDDLEGNRNILVRLLKEYHTFEAENGEEALRLVSEDVPDIILLDIKMPGIDGFEVCRRLKESPQTADVPVIFITGVDAPGVAGKCFKIGAVDFVTKPFDLNEVRARIKTHLTLRKTSADLLAQNRRLEEIIREQRLSSRLARNVLDLIDFPPRRNIKLRGSEYICVNVMSCSCNDEGGDHYLIRTMPTPVGGHKTMISVKDQSGHAVNCILRSIITDLLHNSILYNYSEATLQQNVTMLNNTVFSTGLFEADDFLTALFLEVDHGSKKLDFIAAGHPAFYLIRNGQVRKLPKKDGDGINLPLGFQEDVYFQSGSAQLQTGDKLILYTDGLPEVPMSCGGNPLQSSQLQNIIQEMVDLDKDMPISLLMSRLPAAIINEAGGACDDDLSKRLHDDVTVVGLELTTIVATDWLHFVPTEEGGIDGLIETVYATIRTIAEDREVEIAPISLRMALAEGILNAWKHGNERDSDKTISVGWHLGNDFCLFIRDKGKGFDYHRLQNPIHLDKRLRQSGRGIFCMKKYADFVGWQEGGSTLVISFRFRPHPWENVMKAPGSRIDLWKNPLPEL